MELCWANSVQILLWPQGESEARGLARGHQAKLKPRLRTGRVGMALPPSSPSQWNVWPPQGCSCLVAGLAATESWALMHTHILMRCRGTHKGLGSHFKLLLVF